MFCGKCGSNNPDGAFFCTACGAQMHSQAGNALYNSPAATKRKTSDRTIGIIAVLLAAAIVVVLCVALFGGKSSDSVAVDFVEAMYKADAKTMCQLCPKEFIEEQIEKENFENKNEYYDKMSEELEDRVESLETLYGEKYKFSCKSIGEEAYSNSDLRDIKEKYEDEFDIEVSDAKKEEIEVEEKGKKRSDTFTRYIPVIKIDGTWYIDVLSMTSY
ncbi:MAG: hypothetical protein IJO48_06640 [Clostridia bacterium]|nr:hypothetical protein [Clostridia bacterium]